MTVPAVRKRAKRPKCRTGCITCRARHTKCDEGHPACLRCIKAGRICEGYSPLGVSGATSSRQNRLLLPRSATPLLSKMSDVTTPGLNDLEVQSFDYFRTITVNRVFGRAWDVSWERIALDTSRTKPVVMSAIVALGCLHRSVLQETDSDLSNRAHGLYGQAIASLRKTLSDLSSCQSDGELEVVLLCALLFACFAAFSGRDEQVSLHLRTAFRILSNHSICEYNDRTEGYSIALRTSARSNIDVLAHTLARLDSDLTMVGEDDPFFTVHCNDRLPSFFQTLDEANIHIDSLTSRVFDILDTLCYLAEERFAFQFDSRCNDGNQECLPMLYLAASRFVDIESEPALLQDMAAVEAELNAWQSAFAFLKITAENEAEHVLTRIYFFYIWILVQTWRDKTEMAGDRFDNEYHTIVDLIERYLELCRLRNTTCSDVPAAFSFGTGLVSCICFVTIKCRTSSLRRRCIKTLSTMNLQGVFDTFYLSSYLQAVVDLEERFGRENVGLPQGFNLQCYQVPEQARLLSVTMDPMLHKGQTDFYKRTSGSFVFVRHSEGPESVMGIQSGSSTFVAHRPLVHLPAR